MASRPPEGTPTPTPTPVTEGAPSFEDAFAAAAASDEPGVVVDPAPPAADPPAADPPAGDPPAAAPAPGEPPAGSEPPAGTPPVAPKDGETPPAAPAPAPAPTPPAAPTPSAEEIVKQLTEKLAQPAAPAPGAPPAAPAEQPALYTPEEQSLISEYEKNWPDVAQAETLRRKGEYHDLLKYVFTEVHNFIAPALQQVNAMGNTLHTQELSNAVPDYSPDLEVQVAKWIETQPAYLQAPYLQVMQQGTSEEVADLIGRYRGATGTAPAPAAPAPAGGAAPAPTPKAPAQTELSNLAKQAAESLAPVSSDRTQVPVGEDPQDFQTAFARYAAEEAKPTS